MDAWKKLLEKKKGSGEAMKPEMKDAKMSVLGELRGMANAALGKDLPSVKKVSVVAPDEASLKQGLHKAEDIVEGEHKDKLPDFESAQEEVMDREAERAGEGPVEGPESDMGPSAEDLIAVLQDMSPEDKAKILAHCK